jgi:hypothetical protein
MLGYSQSPKAIKKALEDVKDSIPPMTLNESVTAEPIITPEPVAVVEQKDTDKDADKQDPVLGLGISDIGVQPFPAPAAAATDAEVKTKAKKKTKSKPKSKQSKLAAAELTQMGDAVMDSNDSTANPLHEWSGNDVSSSGPNIAELIDLDEAAGGHAMGPPRLPRDSHRGLQFITIRATESVNELDEGLTQFLEHSQGDVTKTSEKTWGNRGGVMFSNIRPLTTTLLLRDTNEPDTVVGTIDGEPDEQVESPEVKKSRQKLRQMQEREKEMREKAAKEKARAAEEKAETEKLAKEKPAKERMAEEKSMKEKSA